MGTSVKHFAANSRENQRKRCDSIVSDRALREIYLRGFEIAVREGKPFPIKNEEAFEVARVTELIRKAAGQE